MVTMRTFDKLDELWVKGGNVVSGYFDNPQVTQEPFINGWMRTGDFFRVDKDQYLLVCMHFLAFRTPSFASRLKVSCRHFVWKKGKINIEMSYRTHSKFPALK